jgi:hypothetical protein
MRLQVIDASLPWGLKAVFNVNAPPLPRSWKRWGEGLRNALASARVETGRYDMAHIVHCHPTQTTYEYHIYTDLDFWDARKILKGLALVKRNFGQEPSGDEYPTQVVGDDLSRLLRAEIEKRLRKAVVSPPRHVIVRSILSEGFFEFDPFHYYPVRWSPSRVLHFTYNRLPLDQPSLNSAFKTIRLSWVGKNLRVEQIQRAVKHDPVIASKKEAVRRQRVPGCF